MIAIFDKMGDEMRLAVSDLEERIFVVDAAKQSILDRQQATAAAREQAIAG